MLVAFACDAGPSIGTGHVTRCVALAEELASRGHRCVFVGDIEGPAWLDYLVSPFERLSSPDIIPVADVTVLDSYSPQRLGRLRADGLDGRLVVIVDDMTPSVPADAYIEPSVNGAWSPPTESLTVPRISGPEAVLIRDAMRRTPAARASEAGETPTVLVALGGGDGYGLLPTVLDTIAMLPTAAEVRYVSATDLETGATRVPQGGHLSDEMQRADVVICAAGVTSWEALHQGRAVGLLCVVDNQEANYDFMIGSGLAVGLGRLDRGESLDTSALAALMSDAALRHELAERAGATIDGRGAVRAADIIEALAHGGPSQSPDAETR